MLVLFETQKILREKATYIVTALLLVIGLACCFFKLVSYHDERSTVQTVALAEKLGVVIDEEFAKKYYYVIRQEPEYKKFSNLYLEKTDSVFLASGYEEAQELIEEWKIKLMYGEIRLEPAEEEIWHAFNGTMRAYEDLVFGPVKNYESLLSQLEEEGINDNVRTRLSEIIEGSQASYLLPDETVSTVQFVWRIATLLLIVGSAYAALYPIFSDKESGAVSVLDTTVKRFSFVPAQYAASLITSILLYCLIFVIPMLLCCLDTQIRLFWAVDMSRAVLPEWGDTSVLLSAGTLSVGQYILMLFAAAFLMQQFVLLLLGAMNALFRDGYASFCTCFLFGGALCTMAVLVLFLFPQRYNDIRLLPFTALVNPDFLCFGLTEIPHSWWIAALLQIIFAAALFVLCIWGKRHLFEKRGRGKALRPKENI